MTKYILVVLCMLMAANGNATNYYVKPSGNNNNTGTSIAQAFKTLQKAHDVSLPGDTIFILNGTYKNGDFTASNPSWNVLSINRSGTAALPITYINYPGHNPKIRFNGWHGIEINTASYIHIVGISIQGNRTAITMAQAQTDYQAALGGTYYARSNGNGISCGNLNNNATSFTHHITITQCKVYDCCGAGISALRGDYMNVKNNVVYNNSWYTVFGTSGISLYQLKDFNNSTTAYRNVIEGNKVFGNKLLIPWINAYPQPAITDGNGIIIDDAEHTQLNSPYTSYTGKTMIKNNVVYNNGGRGIHVYLSNLVSVINNTCYKNNVSPEITDGEITIVESDECKVINNIAWPRSTYKPLHAINANSLIVLNNLYGANANLATPKGQNYMVGNPQFVQSGTGISANYMLKNTSIAIDAGNTNTFAATDIDGRERPNGNMPDIGAYEYIYRLNNAAWSRAGNIHHGFNLPWLEKYWNGNSANNYSDYLEWWQMNNMRNSIALANDLGFTTVRLPVTFYHWEANLAPPYTLDSSSYFAAIDSVLAWTAAKQMTCIIDYHHGGVTNANFTSEFARLKQHWIQIATYFANTDTNKVLFELYNEPYGVSDSLWKWATTDLINTLRPIVPNHTFITGASGWNGIDNLLTFGPLPDNNIIYTFHCYDPMLFTHQGATWVDGGAPVSTIGMPYPYNAAPIPPMNPQVIGTWGEWSYNNYSTYANRQFLVYQLSKTKKFAVQHAVPVHCGEWGSYYIADEGSRCRYAKDVIEILDSINVPFTFWEMLEGFGFFNGTPAVQNIPQCFKNAFNLPIARFNTDDVLAINEGATIFPNPGNGVVTIKNVRNINRIEIYNALGNKVVQCATNTQMDFSFLPSGFYVVKLFESNKHVATEKWFKN